MTILRKLSRMHYLNIKDGIYGEYDCGFFLGENEREPRKEHVFTSKKPNHSGTFTLVGYNEETRFCMFRYTPGAAEHNHETE